MEATLRACHPINRQTTCDTHTVKYSDLQRERLWPVLQNGWTLRTWHYVKQASPRWIYTAWFHLHKEFFKSQFLKEEWEHLGWEVTVTLNRQVLCSVWMETAPRGSNISVTVPQLEVCYGGWIWGFRSPHNFHLALFVSSLWTRCNYAKSACLLCSLS